MTRKRNRPPKERSVVFTGETKGIVDRLTVTHDEATGELRIEEVDPASLRVEHFYERESGKEKTLLSAPASFSDSRFSYIESIRRDFDYLVAVDTNTRPIAGRRVSVVVAYMTPLLKAHQTQVPSDPLAAYAIVDAAPTVNPECIGWHLILKNHILPAHRGKRLRVGIVVDSDLGLLPLINTRNECYYDVHHAPSYAKFIYASDATADTLPSQMIRYCDKQADRTLDEIAKRPTCLDVPPNGDRHFYTHVRILFRESSQSEA